MPAKSEKQERFMRAVAHSPSFAKKVGVPMSVGREFTKSGANMPIVVKNTPESEKRSAESDVMKRKAVSGMKKGGATKKMAGGGLAAGHKSADGVAHKGKTKARQVTMAGSTGMKKGGMTKMKYGGKAC